MDLTKKDPGYETIDVPNRLAGKIDMTGGPSIEEIEAALDDCLKDLVERYPGVVREVCKQVRDVLRDLREGTEPERRLRAVHRHFHDLKGQAATLGFPLIGEAAAMVCDLILTQPETASTHENILGVFTDAVELMAIEGIQDRSDPRGATLITNLEAARSKAMTS